MDSLISIIIVNFNGEKWLKNCLKSLYDQNYKKIEIIIVDNNSTDGSIDFIKNKYPEIKLLINKKNLGFAEANNIGYKKAKGKYILFLNNDTVVTKDFLRQLIISLESNKCIGGLQSKIRLLENHNYLDSVATFLTFTGFLYHYGINKRNQKKYNNKINIYSAKGACMIFKKKVLDSVLVNGKLFDDSYFAYFEETDLCHRVWLAGYKIKFEPKSVIYHKMGGTSEKMNQAFIQYHSFKNRISSYIKNLGSKKLILILPIHLFLVEVFATISLLKLKINIFWAIQKSIFWNLYNIKEIFRKRTYVQKSIRKVKDKDIWPFIFKSPSLNYYFSLFSSLKNYKDQI